MKINEGRCEGSAVIVTVDGRALNPGLDLWDHSPTSFEWGYPGSGPAQLALAILADHIGDGDRAVAIHQEFKSAVVALLPYHGWAMTDRQIEHAIRNLNSRALVS